MKKINHRTELVRELVKRGIKPVPALMGWDDEQAYKYFECCHPVIYRQYCGLPPKLEVVR